MMMVAIIALLVTASLACLIAIYLVISLVNGVFSALSVPTPNEVLDDIVLALELPEHGFYAEPGCGDGRVIRAVIRGRPQLIARGTDNNPLPLLVAWLRLRGRAKLTMGNIRRMPFAHSDRVFTYLSPRLMRELEPIFQRELEPGARLVSLQFPLPTRPATREIALKRGRPHANRLFIYHY
jgi:hypothetical protein